MYIHIWQRPARPAAPPDLKVKKSKNSPGWMRLASWHEPARNLVWHWAQDPGLNLPRGLRNVLDLAQRAP